MCFWSVNLYLFLEEQSISAFQNHVSPSIELPGCPGDHTEGWSAADAQSGSPSAEPLIRTAELDTSTHRLSWSTKLDVPKQNWKHSSYLTALWICNLSAVNSWWCCLPGTLEMLKSFSLFYVSLVKGQVKCFCSPIYTWHRFHVFNGRVRGQNLQFLFHVVADCLIIWEVLVGAVWGHWYL